MNMIDENLKTDDYIIHLNAIYLLRVLSIVHFLNFLLENPVSHCH